MSFEAAYKVSNTQLLGTSSNKRIDRKLKLVFRDIERRKKQ
jgi:hypothetical protein